MAATICKNKKCAKVIDDSFNVCPYCAMPLRPEPKPKVKRRPKGSGSIVKLKGKRSKPYLVRKSGVVLGTFATWEDANTFLANLGPADPDLKNLTLGHIFERYKASATFKKLDEPSKKNVIGAWKKLEPLANKKMRTLLTTHYQEIIDSANKEDGTGRDGCAKVKTLISHLCKNAMKDKIIDQDFGELIELPEKEAGVQRRNFTEEEIVQLFYSEADRDARIVLCMIYTGTRIDELFSIRKTTVNIEDRYIIGGEKTDAGKNRTIPIRDEIYPYIVQFLNEPGDYLISSPRGKKTNPNNWRTRNFYPLLDRLGINYKDADGNNIITPHRTRHTYISESIAAGIRPEALIKIVGHTSYKTSVDFYDKAVNLDFLQREAQKGL